MRNTNFINIFFHHALLGIFLLTSQGAFSFQTKLCLQADFKTELKVSDWPFGILPKHIELTKNRCVLSINTKRLMDESWTVDICREPIHVRKKSWLGEDVFFAPTVDCIKSQDIYCKELQDLEDLFDHFALIFSPGERDQLETSHGKFYCASLLIRKYLKEKKFFEMAFPEGVLLFDRELTTSLHEASEPKSAAQGDQPGPQGNTGAKKNPFLENVSPLAPVPTK